MPSPLGPGAKWSFGRSGASSQNDDNLFDWRGKCVECRTTKVVPWLRVESKRGTASFLVAHPLLDAREGRESDDHPSLGDLLAASQILIFCSYFQARNVPRPLLGQIHEVKSRGQERRGCAISKPSRTSIPLAHPKTKWKRLENRSPASWPWSSDRMAKTQLGSPAAAIGARGRHGSWLIRRFLQPLVSTPDW